MNPNKDELKIGDEIELYHGGIAPNNKLGKYRVTGVTGSGNQIEYTGEYYNPDRKQWADGHAWENYTNFSWVIINGQQKSVAGKPVAPDNGCVCKKCNSRNQWAAPNQPDGKYICYECR